MKVILLLTSCVAAALAVPASWTPEMAALYSEASLNILDARTKGLKGPPKCDLSSLNITSYLSTIPDCPTPLKDPGTAKLVQVTVGRGVQNYTCADNKDTTKPKAVGAVANLYDVSCIAANYPNLLTLITPFAVQYNLTLDQSGKLFGFNLDRVGHHYFNAQGAPTFDLTDNKQNPLGVLVADKANPDMKLDAPKSASKGQVLVASQQNGAVPWLKLNPLNGTSGGTTGDLATVYRVVTAGGNPPTTCAGQPTLVSIEYAAQYWFYTAE